MRARITIVGRGAYARGSLAAVVVLDQGTSVTVLTWLGDGANEAIACLLTRRGMKAWRPVAAKYKGEVGDL